MSSLANANNEQGLPRAVTKSFKYYIYHHLHIYISFSHLYIIYIIIYIYIYIYACISFPRLYIIYICHFLLHISSFAKFTSVKPTPALHASVLIGRENWCILIGFRPLCPSISLARALTTRFWLGTRLRSRPITQISMHMLIVWETNAALWLVIMYTFLFWFAPLKPSRPITIQHPLVPIIYVYICIYSIIHIYTYIYISFPTKYIIFVSFIAILI